MDAEGMDMERLLVMADDFTGALDTGVQFATYGARTEIITDVKVDFRNILRQRCWSLTRKPGM